MSRCSHLLPTEGAAETAVIGPATQTAGTEDVVAVQQARGLVLLMAQVTHQGVDLTTIHTTKVVQVGEDFSCHLKKTEYVSNDKKKWVYQLIASF